MDGNTALHLACMKQGPNSKAILLNMLAADPGAIEYCDQECQKKTAAVLLRSEQKVGNNMPTEGEGAADKNRREQGEGEEEEEGEAEMVRRGDKADEYRTPLHVAIKAGNVSAVKLLIEAGASVNSTFVTVKKSMIKTMTIVALAQELAVSSTCQDGIEIRDLVLAGTKMPPRNDHTELRKRTLRANEDPETAAVDIGNVAFLDMLDHMWDAEGPEVRRQAEYETALLHYTSNGRAREVREVAATVGAVSNSDDVSRQ